MPALARKLATFARIARAGGARGVLESVRKNHASDVAAYRAAARLLNAASASRDALPVLRRHGRPPLVLSFFGGIGDELLMTAVVHELRRRGHHGTWILTESPGVWQENAGRDLVLRWDRRHGDFADVVGLNAIRPHYCYYDRARDVDVPPTQHVIRLMCERVGILGPITRKPWLTLRDDERERGALVPDQVVIQSAGLAARFPAVTKQWFPERYQQVVDARKGEVNFVQVGSADDPPLEGALDLRGKTSVRETAAILSRSLAFVGQVGMLMHLARAVDCRGVITYGGREHPDQTGYSCNENLYRPVPCSPCWRVHTCPFEMACMREVTVDDAVRALDRQLARAGQPLAVDVDAIDPDPAALTRARDGRLLVRVRDVRGAPHTVEAKPLAPPGGAAAPAAGPAAPAAAA